MIDVVTPEMQREFMRRTLERAHGMELHAGTVGVILVFTSIMAKYRDGNDPRPLTLAELADSMSRLEDSNRCIRRWLAEWPYNEVNR
jgi:hypothetical protein